MSRWIVSFPLLLNGLDTKRDGMNFCTYFDSAYLHRGLVLYRSLRRCAGDCFTLWVLCLDDIVYRVLEEWKLHGLVPIRLEEFEKGDIPLSEAKGNRTRVEYYWTLTPSLPLYLFKCHPAMETICYVDADMCFFSSPHTIFDELGTASILIVPHDYSMDYTDQESPGKYNVGILSFRSNGNGRAALEWWRDRCLEWCYDRHENGKYADQGYLNDWPEKFPAVIVSRNLGVRLAPWNVGKYRASVNKEGQLLVDGQSLVCYHFHAMHFCTKSLVFLASWPVNMGPEWRTFVYEPYIRELLAIEHDLIREGYQIPVPRKGFPLKYIAGRLLKGQPIRNFMSVTSGRGGF